MPHCERHVQLEQPVADCSLRNNLKNAFESTQMMLIHLYYMTSNFYWIICLIRFIRKVECSLRQFAAKLHGLLASHHGILPLSSLDICWEIEFGNFPACADDRGVYLEHLASFVPGVEIVQSNHSFKIISWAQTCTSTDGETDSGTVSKTFLS